ncbi:MAG: hypothetical protein HDT28_06330 [Clostridiales bacterium]|nr:hypothetical protein [Clostridiales bacterium]
MVEFRTVLDSSKTKAVNNNTFKRFWWLFALISLIFIGLGIMGFLVREDDGDLYYAIFCLVFGVLFAPLSYLLTLWLQKRIDKSASYISDKTEEIYTFDDDGITMVQKKDDEFYSTTKAKYSYLYKVVENKAYYFLYISRMQCHIIDKASITQGSISDMENLLIMHLGDKFKRK